MSEMCVIGGSRYFGRRLIENLRDAGTAVTVVNRGSAPAPEGVTHLRADRDDEDALRRRSSTSRRSRGSSPGPRGPASPARSTPPRTGPWTYGTCARSVGEAGYAVGAGASPFSFDRGYAMDNGRATALGFRFSHVADRLPSVVQEAPAGEERTCAPA